MHEVDIIMSHVFKCEGLIWP